MRIVMEITEALRRHRGWGRFNLELAAALAQAASGYHIDFFYHLGEHDDTWLKDRLTQRNTAFHPLRLSRSAYDALEEDRGKSYLDAQFPRADLYHAVTEFPFHVATITKLTTVHEVSPLLYPEYFQAAQLNQLRTAIEDDVRRSARLATVSEVTKADLLRLFAVTAESVEVIPNGVANIFLTAPLRLSVGVSPALLFVGPVHDPLKGFAELWQAFTQLPASFTLTIVAADTTPESFATLYAPTPDQHRRLRFKSQLSDQELCAEYLAATLLVFPSLHEGFGLPVAEAMAVGLPVVCRRTSGPLEVAGEYAYYYTHGTELAATIRRAALAPDPGVSRALREKVRHLTWAKTARSYLLLYEKILRQKTTARHQ